MIVLDTNILVAGLRSRAGASSVILERVLRREIDCAVSVALALEYEDVLTRAQMLEASWASIGEIGEFLDALLHVAKRMAPITVYGRPRLRDPDDEMVLECALQSQARTIVTMNLRDFAGVSDRFGIAICRPGDYLAGTIGGRS